MLEEQRKRIEESEECFKTDRKQLERQFTLQGQIYNGCIKLATHKS